MMKQHAATAKSSNRSIGGCTVRASGRRAWGLVVLTGAFSGGCQALIELDDYGFSALDTALDGGAGATGTGAMGSGGAGTPGGAGGALDCAPGAAGCEEPPGTCTPDQRKCEGAVPQRCEDGAWVPETPCSGETPACHGSGLCGCEDGLTRCTDAEHLERCESGTWVNVQCSVQCIGEPGAAACGSVARVTAGRDHTCAVLSTGAVRCWGEGAGSVQAGGQLGYGSTEDVGTGSGMYSSVALGPAAVFAFAAPELVEEIASGGNHTCIRRTAGRVQCWGDNDVGQLGLGHTAPFSAMSPDIDFDGDPTLVEVASRIATGEKHSCAITSTPSTGGVRCWGENQFGQLGTNGTEDVGCGGDGCGLSGEVSGGFVVFFGTDQRAVEISAGADHSCALLSSGGTRCWGSGVYGQLGQGDALPVGDGTRYVDAVPDIDFGQGLTATQISAGAHHSCAVLSTGAVRCWGRGELGRLGNGGLDNVGAGEPSVYPTVASAPNVNLGGVTATKVAAGGSHTCALLSTGAVRCWGDGRYGQLGIGAAPEYLAVGTGSDVDFGPGITATDISAGYDHTCALVSSGGVRCWGQGSSGQLGYGAVEPVGDDEAVTRDVPFF